MRHFTPLSSICLVLLFPLSVTAQDEIETTLYTPGQLEIIDEEGESWDVDLYGTIRVSNNGKYAVGCDIEACYAGYLWDAETGSFTIINEASGERVNAVLAYDVSDDGTIVGAVPVTYEASDGSDSIAWEPAYKPLGKDWVTLPMPEYANTKYNNPKYYSMSYIPAYGKRVSPDGKVIGGVCWYAEYDAAGKYTNFYKPVLWTIGDDGEATLKEFNDLEYKGQGFILYDINDDGSVIVGKHETVRGDQCPAYIKDGVMDYLASPILVLRDGYTDVYDEVGDDVGAYWIGLVNFLDASGNAYYYYSDGGGVLHNAVWNVYTEETIYSGEDDDSGYDNLVLCGTGSDFIVGMQYITYGPATVLAGQDVDISEMSTVMSVSDDGLTLAGATLQTSSLESYNSPAVMVLSSLATGISSTLSDDKSVLISKNGNTLSISGEYTSAELIDTAGRHIGNVNKAISLSGMPAGVYLLKVESKGKKLVYKILL